MWKNYFPPLFSIFTTQNYVPISLKKEKDYWERTHWRSNNFLWQWSATITINRKNSSDWFLWSVLILCFLQHSLKSPKYSFPKAYNSVSVPPRATFSKEQRVLKGRTSSQLSLSRLSKSGPFLVDFYMGHNTDTLSSKSSKNHSSKNGPLITFFFSPYFFPLKKSSSKKCTTAPSSPPKIAFK